MKNFKVQNKLLIIILVSIFISTVIGIYGFTQTRSMSIDMEKIYEEKFIPNNWISGAVQTNLRIDSILVEMMLTTDLEEKKELHSEINTGVDAVLANFAKYEAMDLTPEEREQLANFYTAVEKLTGNQDLLIEHALAGRNDEAYKLFVDVVRDARGDLITSLTALNDIKEKQTAQISSTNIAQADKVTRTIVIVNVIGCIILITISLLLTRLITRPLNIVKTQLETVQTGDLTIRSSYDSKDELGTVVQSVNNTVTTLQDALKQVNVAANSVGDSANELTANIEQASSAASQVAVSTQEIASGSEHSKQQLEANAIILDKVSSQLSLFEKELLDVDAIALKAYNEATVGTSIINENVSQMQTVQQSIANSNDVILNLSSKVGEVDEILKVINGISEQTNLLALNAAIEAARAGEHGKGFAVVADEVRKLAEQSLQSTKSIATILSNIKQDTTQSVQIMSIAMKEANEGLQKTVATATKFDDILTSTQEVAPKVEMMSNTMSTMQNDFKQFANNADSILSIAINNAANTEQVSAFTQEQAAAMEHMRSSAQALTEVSEQLNKVTNQFKL